MTQMIIQVTTASRALILSVVMFALLAPTALLSAAVLEPGFEVETIAGGLVLPTAITFSPDGRIFIAEKGGTVRVVKDGVLLETPVITLTDVNTYGDRGLLGITTDPDFLNNGYLYLSYTYENSPGSNYSGEKTGRIVRVTVVGDTANGNTKQVILGTVGGSAAQPSCENFAVTDDCIPSDSPSHSVGALRFGPDGLLYATLGEAANFDYADPKSLRAQDIDSLAGKVVRIYKDGTAPTDNPFYNGDPNANRSKVYALGVRNAFRMNFHPQNGSLYLGDVGWSAWEEINEVTPGANFGWPCLEGTEATSHNCTASSTTTDPTYAYPHNEAFAGAVIIGSFPSNGAYPTEYDSSLFFGDYAQNWIKRAIFDESGNVIDIVDFSDDPNGPVDITTGPDGTIYYIAIYTGELMRITHTTGNRRPVPQMTATPQSGLLPLSVDFSSEGSVDPDGDAITFAWNFGDGATSTEANPTHVYTTEGAFNASLTVTDAFGSSHSISETINAGNQAPDASITSPANGSLYVPFEEIQLQATATDLEDGTLPDSAFSWDIILHHNTHTHVIQQFVGVKNPVFTAPDHNASDVYTEVILNVTDSGGVVTQKSINLYLNNGIQTGNLIVNPSVEIEAGAIPARPEGWERGGWGTNTRVYSYPVEGFEGEKGLMTEVTSYTDGDAKWFFLPINVTPGKTYLYSDYYTADVPTEISAQFGLPNGTFQFEELGNAPPASTPTKVERLVTIPEGVQTLSVFHEVASVGTLITDDFSLTLVEETLDTEAPSVSIISPVASTTVSGMVTIEVTATDDNAIEHVEILVDGIEVGEALETAPYTFQWDTTQVDNGVHTISAHAHDTSENTGHALDIVVTVDNEPAINLIANGDFEIEGADGNPENWTPVVTSGTTAVFTYPTVGEDGGKAAHIQITDIGDDGNARWQFDEVPITTGVEYTYEEYYKGSTIHDIIGRYSFADGSEHFFGLVKEVPAANEWTRVSGTFIGPENVTGITLMSMISTNATLDIDTVSMFATGTGTPAEIEAPETSFTYPLNGDTVSGVVSMTANATDNVGIAGWFFAVDGSPLHLEQSGDPITLDWDSSTVSNGTHTLKITVRDAAGNNNREIITVNVNNQPATSSSLILNPSLETVGTNGDPASWFRGGWGTNTRVFTYPVAGNNSDRAARVEITSYTDGDAKWYFADAFVIGGETYVLSHDYKSTIGTNMLIRYTLEGGATQYQFLGAAPASPTWTTTTSEITIPANATSLTLFHVINAVGSLEIDNFSLELKEDEPTPSVNLIQNPSLDTVGTGGNPEFWLRGGWGTNTRIHTYPITGVHGSNAARVEITSYTNGDAKWYFADTPVTPNTTYTFSHQYKSTTPTEILARYTLTNGSYQYVFLGALPQTATWSTTNYTFDAPANATAVTIFHYLHSVGVLEIDNYSLTDGTPPSVDTTVPVVSVTSPVANATLSGTITVQISASDNVGVSGVTLHIDGNAVGIEDTTSPYAFVLDTTTLPNGTHTLSAIARDAAGNTATATPVSVDVSNTSTPPTTNLIQNPSFETLDEFGVPLHWEKSGFGNNDGVHSISTGENGGNAAKVAITSYTDGDAKWFFADTLVTGGSNYTFESKYRANVATDLTVRYTMQDGSFQYVGLAAPAAAPSWTTLSQTFVVPTGAVSLTIMHILHQAGELEIDEYSLVEGNTYAFDNGMVSLTFDDAWYSHYSAALPILNAANVPGGFYIVSQEMINANESELLTNPSLAIVGANGDPEQWFRGGWGANTRVFTYPTTGETDSAARVEITSYTNGDAKWYFADTPINANERYVLSDRYNSNTATPVFVRYTYAGGSVSYTLLDTLPSSNGAWQTFERTVTTPANAVSMTVFHALQSTGSLSIDSFSLKHEQTFLNTAQMLEMQASGHEIGAHTQTHANLAEISLSEAQGEIEGSRSDMLAAGATPMDMFVYPFGAYTSEVQTLTQNAGFTAARSVERGYNTKATDKYALKIQAVLRDTTFAEVEAWIAQAQADNTWLILMFHQIDNDPAAAFGTTPELLQQTVNEINTSGIEVVTMQEGVARMNP